MDWNSKYVSRSAENNVPSLAIVSAWVSAIPLVFEFFLNIWYVHTRESWMMDWNSECMYVEDNGPRNAFKPRVQPRKPSLPLARNASGTEDVLEHASFNRMFEKRDEVDEETSPTYLPVWKPQVISPPSLNPLLSLRKQIHLKFSTPLIANTIHTQKHRKNIAKTWLVKFVMTSVAIYSVIVVIALN